jgi:hypothetical protein
MAYHICRVLSYLNIRKEALIKIQYNYWYIKYSTAVQYLDVLLSIDQINNDHVLCLI